MFEEDTQADQSHVSSKQQNKSHDESFIILGTLTRDMGEGATVFVSHMAVRRGATKIWTISDTTVYVSHM